MIATEKKVIEAMMAIYCSGHHNARGGLCRECFELLEYAKERLDKCHFGDKKPTCAKCPIHCYSPSVKPRITAVMGYAGPRMLSKHPILALRHAIRGLR